MENFCTLCPRNCKADRNKAAGFCGAPNEMVVAHVGLHFGEEPCVSGESGSGTVFFSHCNLKCVFCQNEILRDGKIGKEITPSYLASLFLRLEKMGACNINLVSGMHFVDKIIDALKIYKPKLPIVWNTNAYEKEETIEKLAKYVDVFLPDLKFFSSKLSLSLAKCSDYFDVASKAILKMNELKPTNIFDENGIIQSGVIIRHLILPNQTKDSLALIDFLNSHLPDCTISLMSQYVPMGKAKEMPELNRAIKPIEYNRVLGHIAKTHEVYAQDLSSATDEYVPMWRPEDV